MTDRRQNDRRQGERRQGDRRGMEALRAEALQTVISRVEDRNFGGLRNRFQWGRGMKPSRLVLLLVALVAGGAAGYLAMQRDQPIVSPAVAEQPLIQYVPEARTRILVAREAIGVGRRLTAATIGWEDWPEGAVRAEYITASATPEAIETMSGAVARSGFLPGEPIREEKLTDAGLGGHLSATLESGKRAVSVSVSAEAASGGFIVPNDRVDVMLTRSSGQVQASETIVHNARVLAINSRLGETAGAVAEAGEEALADPEVFTGGAIATLELDPIQAGVIMSAIQLGRLTLVLRPTADFAEAATIGQLPANQAIRLSSPFWSQ